jgi:hypothetical protein
MHTTTPTNTIRMTCFHHVGTVFQRGHMPVSSDGPDRPGRVLGAIYLCSGRPAWVLSQGSPGDHVRA